MQILINEKKQELKEHGNYEFPVHVSEEVLSLYEKGSFLWHWHPEIELTLILDGEIEYYVDDRKYLLKKGEGLFCNVNSLHAGNTHDRKECKYISVTFHPRFIYGYENSIIQRKYIEEIIHSKQCSSIFLREESEWQREILKEIKNIYMLFLLKSKQYELKVHISLCKIWIYLTEYFQTLPEEKKEKEKNKERLKQILLFIQENYKDKITLEDIAKSVNICKSECCRFFKKYMKMSLFDYLLSYRIQQSLPLLRNQDYTITEIAGMSGFINPCYYTKIFKRYQHCSPREYRTMQMQE